MALWVIVSYDVGFQINLPLILIIVGRGCYYVLDKLGTIDITPSNVNK